MANDRIPSPELWQKAEESKSDIMIKYRKEMMELLKDLPETTYELTFRDMVEICAPENASDIKPMEMKKGNTSKKGSLKRESMGSRVILQGFFLPKSLVKWRSKVSPKPVPSKEKGFRSQKRYSLER